MRKLIAILLLVIQVFNLAGYRYAFDLLAKRSNEKMVSELDKRIYDDKELVEVKVPLLLNYFYSWNDFERFDGEIEFNGVHYNYVKRKVSNDTLVLLCIPNLQTARIHQGQQDYFRQVNDVQNNGVSKKDGHSNLISRMVNPEYVSLTAEFDLNSFFEFKRIHFAIRNDSPIPDPGIQSPGQPPEVISDHII